MKDLEQRMKENYENREKHFLPRRTNTIIRVDGKKFSKYTSKFHDPYDNRMLDAMENTMLAMLEEMQGVQFAYTQSDEINFLLKDDQTETTQAYFDGNVQKIASVTASLATGHFNNRIKDRFYWWEYGMPVCKKEEGKMMVEPKVNKNVEIKPAFFDSRVFTIPDPVEVENYFIWRNKDAIRNAVSSYGRYFLGHKTLYKRSSEEIFEMINERDDTYWDKEDDRFKYGTIAHHQYDEEKERYKWTTAPAFDFTEYRQEFIYRLFPETSTVYGTPD